MEKVRLSGELQGLETGQVTYDYHVNYYLCRTLSSLQAKCKSMAVATSVSYGSMSLR
jgi:hypothetical protein